MGKNINKIYWFFRKLYDKYSRKKDTTLIPKGIHCWSKCEHSENKETIKILDRCPYWACNKFADDQEFGYCSFLSEGDWEDRNFGLLWDSYKECDVNIED